MDRSITAVKEASTSEDGIEEIWLIKMVEVFEQKDVTMTERESRGH